ncbi:hypothetical protein P7C71_g3516, partial [Lecanoromycetidae sp. Uapishka_2]
MVSKFASMMADAAASAAASSSSTPASEPPAASNDATSTDASAAAVKAKELAELLEQKREELAKIFEQKKTATEKTLSEIAFEEANTQTQLDEILRNPIDGHGKALIVKIARIERSEEWFPNYLAVVARRATMVSKRERMMDYYADIKDWLDKETTGSLGPDHILDKLIEDAKKVEVEA